MPYLCGENKLALPSAIQGVEEFHRYGSIRSLFMVGFKHVSRSIQLDLYGTSGCHLCDEAARIIQEVVEANPQVSNRFSLNHIDISETDELIELYGLRIPVLRVNQSDIDQCSIELAWPYAHQEFVDFLNIVLGSPC